MLWTLLGPTGGEKGWGRGSWRGSQRRQWVSEDGVWLGGGGWGPAQGMVRWNGLLIPQREGTPLLPMSPPRPPPHSTRSKRSGQGRCKETVNSGAASSLSLVRSESSDRAPVPPLPFSQVVLETQACWLESGGSLGPCPPPPLHHPAKPGTSPALAQAKRGSRRPGKEELSRALPPGLDLLPGKMKMAPRGCGTGRNLFGLCNGWGFLEGQMWGTGVHTEVLPQIQIANLEGPSGSWGYPGSH